jgi:hypothetical protein
MDMLRPDMKAILWLAIGFYVAPKAIAFVRSSTS